jgi:outer membrane lipoprotein-sorting protein
VRRKSQKGAPEFLHDVLRVSLMRRLILILAPLVLLLSPNAGQAKMDVMFTQEQVTDLDKVSAYLNGIHSLKANFIQIGPDGGMAQGQVYLQKPGRIRFEYTPPSPVLMVATGGSIYVQNTRLRTVDRYDVSDTPLGLLLNDNIDLKTNSAVIGVAEHDGVVIVRARSSSRRDDANIAIVFSLPNMELRQWSIKDNQGGVTTVALQGVEPGASIDPALFTPPVRVFAKSKNGR